ncbi:hypothetical protein [Saccharothrix sp. HUAS TT1]|uniref:hypothetical protein n=1 Tax=unclassified Saccharothrix TaxID=2593673 RepID=UPI00345B768E
MRLADRVLRLLEEHPAGLADAEIATALHVVHQQVNGCCRRLAQEGRIAREDLARPIRNRLLDPGEPAPPRPVAAAAVEVDRREEVVQGRAAAWLEDEGWKLLGVADTAAREHGTDIRAERAGVLLHVEVKGYPSRFYADPRRADEVKPAQPATQARHWFASAVLKVLQLRQAHPDDEVAFAFPDMPTYRALLATVETAVIAMRLSVFLVRDDGSVEARWRTPS